MTQAFSKIWIMTIVVVLTAGGVLAWQHFGIEKEETANPEEYFISPQILSTFRFLE